MEEIEVKILNIDGPLVEAKLRSFWAKIREEYEYKPSGFDETINASRPMGLNETYSFKKRRKSYLLNDVHFEFDKFLGSYAFVPEFLEIEAKDIETIYKYASELGFKKEDCKPYSVADIVKEIKEKQNEI